uniref:Uncharacterized protein n=1 Tax=Pyxicephalus adspersus TaxID=30357 RepID=A0AAV3AD38_PYXAD|nr:TPA: hypothetical protein GDO54_013154 [Pyxicephalus adspersus]
MAAHLLRLHLGWKNIQLNTLVKLSEIRKMCSPSQYCPNCCSFKESNRHFSPEKLIHLWYLNVNLNVSYADISLFKNHITCRAELGPEEGEIF